MEYESVTQETLLAIESMLHNAKQLQHARFYWQVRCPSGILSNCSSNKRISDVRLTYLWG
jgi:hypothetical protein